MLVESSKSYKSWVVWGFLIIKDNKTNIQWLKCKENIKNTKLKNKRSVTLKTISVSWEPGMIF